MKTDKSMYVGM